MAAVAATGKRAQAASHSQKPVKPWHLDALKRRFHIGLTIGFMELWHVPHPPAGATTMIVSLGLMSQLWQLGVLMAAVLALVALGWCINHFVGIPYPLWRPLAQNRR